MKATAPDGKLSELIKGISKMAFPDVMTCLVLNPGLAVASQRHYTLWLLLLLNFTDALLV